MQVNTITLVNTVK